ncbi:TPA: DNA alkylation repair protein [Clostridioides difficile]|uniref:DNA alkylation repair protein n=1 Tax=Clostridioides difficile TaxID=1496 RepID=UPI00038D0107|nr:DNA alkylation repair protein [Clostridioides difficile]EQI12817.1 DNA alkylation repair enzyme family protein [Clostridioides difficile F253]HBG5747215.1 DNA alkylation repair protein [Clostridioides difficile]HBG5824038.1 DNA alkylation repair protein [Clostridioides difficile]HBG6309733.1 DNA alkylation repair protein [Clostridioides difficile]HBG6382654.1 DNA alkylation repair protein [Clostridioides difficile]
MPELLKNMYNRESLYEVAVAIQSVYNSFKVDEFIKSTMDETWNNLELKARCRKISMSLGMYLPEDYKEALSILEKSVTGFYFAFFFPDFVEVYGQDEINWDLSISALERNTEYWSSEFAVRAFIIKDEERMMAQMRKWSKHKSEHVRRLASEGCRPQLPWGQAISKFKKDPTPVLPILEQLKTDTSTYVQKSVANNLNDISKTHPDLVISIAKDWYGKNKSTNWIVKHGCRTLLKKGNRDVLALFGYDDTISINLQDFTLETTSISIGEDLTFSFNILAKKATKTRLEYGIDYMKSNGKRNRKIFKISEVSLKENEKKSYMKKHSFADVSVRRHYPGIHSITIIINGVEKGKLDFELGV